MNTRKLVFAALMAALAAVGTMVIQIPTATGYVHLGDSMVILSGILLGPVFGGLAAGIGSGLADMLSGWGQYAPATFLIKGSMALVAGLVWMNVKKNNHDMKTMIVKYLMAFVPCALILVGGYYVADLFLWDHAGAVSMLVPNSFQGVVGGALGMPLAIALQKAGVERLMHMHNH